MKVEIEMAKEVVEAFRHRDLPSGAMIKTAHTGRDVVVLRIHAGWVTLNYPEQRWSPEESCTGTRLPPGTVVKLAAE